MTEDARPGGLGELANFLAKSIREESKIKSIATTVSAMSVVNWDGDARDQWTSLVDVAADRPTMFAALLQVVGEYLETTIYRSEFLQWCKQNSQNRQNRQSDHARIDQAVSDVRRSRSSLLALSDPRKGKLHLRAMRSSVMEIKEIIEAMPGKVPSTPLIIADDTEEAVAARSEILFACEEALREVDQLMIDILEAGRQSGRVRQEYSSQEAFTAERSMVRHLLHDRGLVDLESQALLEVIDQQLAHLGIPVAESDLQRQAAPPQRAES